jgi:hypothetical protein
MLKQKCSRCSGLENPHHEDKSTSESLKCEGDVDSFLIGRLLFIMSLFHVVRQSIEFHLKVMKRLREAVQRRRPESWTNKIWMLHHDNAPPLVSLLIREYLAKQETIIVTQPPTLQIWPLRTFSCLQS